jgi:hypothetical protein
MLGVSPVIATVLIIAFTVAVVGIFGPWLLTFHREETKTISEQARKELICSFGNILLKDVRYCSTTDKLTGRIENHGTVQINEVKLSVFFANASFTENPLCLIGTSVQKCETSNLTLEVGSAVSFSLKAGGSNFDFVRALTKCPAVYSDVLNKSIIFAC